MTRKTAVQTIRNRKSHIPMTGRSSTSECGSFYKRSELLSVFFCKAGDYCDKSWNMGIFPFVSSAWSAGCAFSCSVGKTAQNANKGRFLPFFCRRLATTLQGIVCRCWVIRYRENSRANSVITKERITGSINYPSILAMRVFVCFSDSLRQVIGNQFL